MGDRGRRKDNEDRGRGKAGNIIQEQGSLTIWPSVKSKKSLRVTYLNGADLFLVHDFFTPMESKAFIDTTEQIGYSHQGSLGPAKGEAFRDNDRIGFDDPILARAVWESGLNKLFADIRIRGKAAVGLNPNIRFYRYKVGQRFGRHIDESVHIGEDKRTHYTLLVYLSGNSKFSSLDDSSAEQLVGGETVFYGPRNSVVAEVAPTRGMALLHVHGDKCLLHEARNVARGVKYVFRSDVAFA